MGIPGGLLVPGTPFQYVVLNPTANQNNAAQSSFTEELQVQGEVADGRLNYVIGGYLEFARPIGWNAGNTSVFLDCASPRTRAVRQQPPARGLDHRLAQ